MIEIVTGVPGGGKTSYAITRLVKTFSKDEKLKKKIPNSLKIPDVKQALTNINELKVDKFNNVFFFNFDDLYEKIKELEYKYRKEKWNDEQLKALSKELNIYETMFIIDEFHNFFDKQDKVLVWWLSYHRHLHQHLILITQNLSLVNTKYKSFTEIYLKAIPSSLKIFDKNIVLKKYTNSRLSKNSQAGTIKIKKFDEIFEMYGSGANHKSKSVILPYIILSIFLIIIIFIYFKFFIYSSKPKEEIKRNVNQEKPKSKHVKSISKPKKDFNNKKIISIFCNKEDCYYHNNIFSRAIIDNKSFGVDVITRKFYSNIMQYDILISDNLYYLFNNEKSNLLVVTKNSTVSSVIK